MIKFLGRQLLTFVVLLSANQASADWWNFWSDEQVLAQVQVAEPFVELRTGPAQGFPVVHSLEKGEWLTLLKRKTDWIKVADAKGQQGWINIEDILLTRDVDGEPVDLKEPRFDDYRTRRWESGMMMGEFDETSVNSGYIGYWMTENLSAELSASQVLGSSSEIQMFNLSLTHQLFPTWRFSPFFTLGAGQIKVKPKATLVSVENDSNETAHVGVGMRCYVSDRFFVRAEVKDYKVFTENDSNEEITEWKLGLSVFF